MITILKINDLSVVNGSCIFKNNDFKIFIITNQSGVERGYYTIEQMNAFNNFMKTQFAQKGITITDVYCCPHLEHPDRKPAPGMFLNAMNRYNIDMSASIAVGDKERDVEAALSAGVKDVYLFDKNAKNSKGKIISNLIDIKF